MSLSQEPAEPFFLRVGSRQLFALHHRPRGTVRGALVHVPPFCEEMNKSRRMTALQSRSLAASGWHVLQFDLFGTGDSEGEFADATWEAWLEDVQQARSWLARVSGIEPWLWGLRLGALLACQASVGRGAPGLLLWQPVVAGKQALQQFLRLKAGAEWLAGPGEGESRAKPMDELRSGRAVEVAGYTLSPELALPMAAADLRLPLEVPAVHWFELALREDATLSPAAQGVLAPLGDRARGTVVRGPSFWQAVEIETCPQLIELSTAALSA